MSSPRELGSASVLTFKVGEQASEEECATYPARVFEMLADYYESLKDVHVNVMQVPNGSLTIVSPAADNSHATFMLRFYEKEKLFTLNIDTMSGSIESERISFYYLFSIKKRLLMDLKAECINAGPIVNLSTMPQYFLTSSDLAFEYYVTEVLFHERTPFQDVKICKTITFGNVLILDNMHNLAESDIAYTHGLMNYGNNDYKDKEILILGGGDGALLHELRKESPKFVTMVDIDEVVLKACSRYLRSVCGDTLDNFDGPNYKIIIGECVEQLKWFAADGRTFDYVINDLTDLPLSKRDDYEQIVYSWHRDLNEHWDLIKQIIDLSFNVLKPNGIYINHACGQDEEPLRVYDEILEEKNLKFKTHDVYVPSFHEQWIFYEVTK